jgi:hypothetical protein
MAWSQNQKGIANILSPRQAPQKKKYSLREGQARLFAGECKAEDFTATFASPRREGKKIFKSPFEPFKTSVNPKLHPWAATTVTSGWARSPKRGGPF